MGDLHVEDRGNGPCVLLLHAGIADGRGWDAVAARLVDGGYRVLVPDARGFGRSPDPTGPFDRVADAVGVLDDAGVDAAHVVGWSMGGGIAAGIAIAHADRVRSVAFVNSVPPGFDRCAAVVASWTLEEQLWEAGDVDAMVQNDVETWAVGIGRSVDDVPAAVVEHVAATSRDQVERYREEFDDLDATPDVGADQVLAITAPMLTVHSPHDHDDVRDAAARMRERDAGVVEVVVPGCAHAGPMERPAAYAEALLDFLRDANDQSGAA